MDNPLSDCQKCRGCCKFEADEVYFAPLFTDQEVDGVNLVKNKANVPFNAYKNSDNIFQVKLIKSKKDESVYVCPYLDEESHLCSIYEKRPFDCKIWPFIFMKDKEGRILLCYDGELCPSNDHCSSDEFDSIKTKFLLWLDKNNILDFIKKYSQLVWDYEDDMVIVKEIEL